MGTTTKIHIQHNGDVPYFKMGLIVLMSNNNMQIIKWELGRQQRKLYYPQILTIWLNHFRKSKS